jgi:hypothetical protein
VKCFWSRIIECPESDSPLRGRIHLRRLSLRSTSNLLQSGGGPYIIDNYHNLEISASQLWADTLLRVAVVVWVIVIVFRAVLFVFLFVFFVFFVVWFLSKNKIGNRLIRRIATLWMYSAHVQWYATYSYPLHLPPSGAFRTGAFWRFQAYVTKLDNLQGTSSGLGWGHSPKLKRLPGPSFVGERPEY